ncbi:MAG: GAF domain-containing protein [Candidatus Koribacter versatilis]|uniref:diguanylate cyclase n=1 Tax=Candidatus Korobacter versatilis TaxID=658062 RepID=A0A932ENN8_9BACT|nr:GAF domain-containing protein [Candidatus Koribacter versatilis]
MDNVHPSVREIAVLQEATEMILSSVDVDTVLHQILLIVRNYFGIKNCAIFLADDARTHVYVRAQNGYGEEIDSTHRLRIGEEGVTGWVAHTGVPLYVPDVSKEPRYVAGDASVCSELALPLVVREEVVGVLDIESDKIDYFTDDMIGLLALFAGQAAVALENARLYSTERRRMRQIELINLIARSATAANEIEQFLTNLSDLTYDTFEGTDVCILLRGSDGKLALRARAGAHEHHGVDFSASERGGIIAKALSARSNVVVHDVTTQPDWPVAIPGAGSELCVPLVSFGETLGVVLITHERPQFFTTDDRAIAQAASDVCATAIKNVQLSEELRRVTSTDSLTGVFNQRYFHTVVAQEVTRAKRYGKGFALAMLDLKDFRQVNAALGFDEGDNVLRQAAQAIKGQVRSIDTVCRYAGDRFALVMPETGKERASAVVAKVEAAITVIEYRDGKSARKVASSSAMVQYPQDGATELELIRLLLTRVATAKANATAAKA